MSFNLDNRPMPALFVDALGFVFLPIEQTWKDKFLGKPQRYQTLSVVRQWMYQVSGRFGLYLLVESEEMVEKLREEEYILFYNDFIVVKKPEELIEWMMVLKAYAVTNLPKQWEKPVRGAYTYESISHAIRIISMLAPSKGG